jgi:hypothetical protein
MHQSPLLLAAGFDWLEALAGSAFVIIWLISQVINVFRAAAGRKAAPTPPAPERQPPARVRRPARPRDGTDAQTDVERQIEEFLRDRRGGRRPDDAAAARQPPPPLPKPARAAPAAPRAAPAAEVSGNDVSRHVADAFAHQLDHLSPGLAEAAARPETRPQPASAGAELGAALRSPAMLRQLFLLRAVLDRPTERW